MKKLVFFVLLFSLTACVAPPAITLASLAISGVSYLETGKTLPDHALSSFSERDCIVFRAARGERVCQDPAATAVAAVPESVPAAAAPRPPAAPVAPVTVAALPAPAPAEAAVLAVPVARSAADASPLQWAPPPLTASDRAALNDLAATASAPAPALDVPATPVSSPVPARPVQVAAATPAVPAGMFVPMMPGDIMAPPERPARATRSKSVPLAQVAMSETVPLVLPAADQPPAPGLHLVVGSFRERARAEAHVADLDQPDLKIVAATVKGRTQYRVVTGALERADLATAKRAYAARGVKGAWAVMIDADAPRVLVAAR
jgi:hypothetical protein